MRYLASPRFEETPIKSKPVYAHRLNKTRLMSFVRKVSKSVQAYPYPEMCPSCKGWGTSYEKFKQCIVKRASAIEGAILLLISEISKYVEHGSFEDQRR